MDIVESDSDVPKKGDVKWSKFFHGYVVLEHYESDCEWYFSFQNGIGKIYKAQSCWSELIDAWPPGDNT